jgi:hypothetical protein
MKDARPAPTAKRRAALPPNSLVSAMYLDTEHENGDHCSLWGSRDTHSKKQRSASWLKNYSTSPVMWGTIHRTASCPDLYWTAGIGARSTALQAVRICTGQWGSEHDQPDCRLSGSVLDSGDRSAIGKTTKRADNGKVKATIYKKVSWTAYFRAFCVKEI